MSIVGKKVHWYRNQSEKDANEVKGSGTVAKVLVLERVGAIEVLLVLEDGSLITKDISLVKMAIREERETKETLKGPGTTRANEVQSPAGAALPKGATSKLAIKKK